MKAGAVVRDATPDDFAATAALLAELGYPASLTAAREHIERFTADPSARLQLAESADGTVVGLVATHIVPRMDDDRFSCRITDIVVARTARRGGVGSALLAAAHTIAAESGAPRLDLASGNWRQDAHAFYAHHGFQTGAQAFTKRLVGIADLEALEAFEMSQDIAAYRDAKASDDGARVSVDELRRDEAGP